MGCAGGRDGHSSAATTTAHTPAASGLSVSLLYTLVSVRCRPARFLVNTPAIVRGKDARKSIMRGRQELWNVKMADVGDEADLRGGERQMMRGKQERKRRVKSVEKKLW